MRAASVMRVRLRGLRTLGGCLLLKAGAACGLVCMRRGLLGGTTSRLLTWTLSGLHGAGGGLRRTCSGLDRRAGSAASDADRTVQGAAQTVVYDSAGADRKR